MTTSTSATHISFTWSIPYDGGSPITYYLIYWDEGNGGTILDQYTELAMTTDPDNTFTLDHSLVPGEPFQFSVKAVNIVGASLHSDSVTFIAASLPATPEAPYKVFASTTQIKIEWLSPSGNGSPINNFKLY
jgi:hypothetical protein